MARVIAYAVIDSSVEWTGCQTLYVGDRLLGRVPRLALCENIDGTLADVLLFHCDDEWAVLGTSGGATLDAAKAIAERAYRGISAKWVHTEVTREGAERWIRANHPNSICSFCGRLPTNVEGLIDGDNAQICFDCVRALFAQINGSPNDVAPNSPGR